MENTSFRSDLPAFFDTLADLSIESPATIRLELLREQFRTLVARGLDPPPWLWEALLQTGLEAEAESREVN